MSIHTWRYKGRLAATAAIILLALAFQPGQALTQDRLLEKIQSTYEAITGMKVSFSQVLLHRESGGREVRTGELLFKKPFLLRWDIKDPEEELLLVTPEVIWNVFPEADLAYKYLPELVDDSWNLARVITGQARLEQDFVVERTEPENGLAVLRLSPKKPTQSLMELVLWVDAASGLIRKCRVYDFFWNENEVTFTAYDMNATFSDSAFAYSPPPGMVVEDRAAEGVIQAPLLQ